MTTSLTLFISNENLFREVFKKPLYNVNNLTPEQVSTLKSKVEGRLSPENLHQDGEASAKQVTANRLFLNHVMHELDNYKYATV